jgi:three-Cys-motif partner protein
MADPILWDQEPHTAAKHRVLRCYLDGWIPVMAQQTLNSRAYRIGAPRLLLVDGFAGPGRYATGESGSPLLMLEALLSHAAFPKFGGIQFIYLFIEHDPRRISRLKSEMDALGPLPSNVTVHVEHGEFETTFGALLDQATDHGKTLVPTFTFIDPFGYSTASMSLTGRLLTFPRCEVLIFLPLTHVHRFVSREGQDAALTSLFGCQDWRAAIDLSGNERRAFLLDLFERQLGSNPTVEHVRSFQLRTHDGNDYRLVFGVGHDKGLDLAKDAMWKVDPVAGTSYAATTQTGQEVLFTPHVDTSALLRELRAKFGIDWFTAESAERYTRIETPFRIGHLRQKTLLPAAKAGKLEIQRATGTRGLDGARLRFLA